MEHATNATSPIFKDPEQRLVNLTYIIYALHTFSALTGVLTSAFVITAFLTGWPSIIAVILNYVYRDDSFGTYLDSHFAWQIRTFWYALLWMVIAIVLMMTIIGIPLGILLMVGVGLWVLYRIARGLLRLNDKRPMPGE
jgi:uncharacterized membrane protein